MYKIALDAGHGLHTPGRRCLKQYDSSETREWQLNSRVAERVEQLLERYSDAEVKRMDDTTGAADIPLAARVTAANAWKADLYISIHHNAGGGTGIVSFCYGAGSAASFSFRDLVYQRLIDSTGNRGNRAEPMTTADFYVIHHTRMPAVLLELGFMDNPVDIQKIVTDDYAKKCAMGIVAAIVEFAGLQTADQPEGKWVQVADGRWRWYRYSDGWYPTKCWKVINGHKYYFDSDGYAVTGWQQIDGKRYHFEPTAGHPLECALYVTDENGAQEPGKF